MHTLRLPATLSELAQNTFDVNKMHAIDALDNHLRMSSRAVDVGRKRKFDKTVIGDHREALDSYKSSRQWKPSLFIKQVGTKKRKIIDNIPVFNGLSANEVARKLWKHYVDDFGTGGVNIHEEVFDENRWNTEDIKGDHTQFYAEMLRRNDEISAEKARNRVSSFAEAVSISPNGVDADVMLNNHKDELLLTDSIRWSPYNDIKEQAIETLFEKTRTGVQNYKSQNLLDPKTLDHEYHKSLPAGALDERLQSAPPSTDRADIPIVSLPRQGPFQQRAPPPPSPPKPEPPQPPLIAPSITPGAMDKAMTPLEASPSMVADGVAHEAMWTLGNQGVKAGASMLMKSPFVREAMGPVLAGVLDDPLTRAALSPAFNAAFDYFGRSRTKGRGYSHRLGGSYGKAFVNAQRSSAKRDASSFSSDPAYNPVAQTVLDAAMPPAQQHAHNGISLGQRDYEAFYTHSMNPWAVQSGNQQPPVLSID